MSTTPSSSTPNSDPVPSGPIPRGGRAFGGAVVRALLIGFAAFLAVLSEVSCTREGAKTAASGGHGAVGTRAPEFALQDLEGRTVKIGDFSGKVVILDFWATWCPPCRQEVPDFVRMQAKYRKEGLAVVGLSLDAGGAKDVRPFVEEFNVNYPMLIANEATANAYGGVVGIPTTFVIDRNGTIVKRFVGFTPAAVFEETIRPLLGSS